MSKPEAGGQANKAAAEPLICYHCGERLEEETVVLSEADQNNASGHDLKFCCHGCRSVYLLIKDSGNLSYYTYRTDFAPRADKSDPDRLPYDVWDLDINRSQEGTKEIEFLIQGIHCASCVWLNEKILSQLPGIIQAEVYLSTNRARIIWDPDKISLREIAEAVASIGYLAVPVQKSDEKAVKKHSRQMLLRMAVAGFFTGNIMLISISLYAGYFSSINIFTRNFFHIISWLMATPVLVYSAAPFFRNAFTALRRGILSMDLLTSAGLTLAYGYSVYVTLAQQGEVFFDSICFVTFAILTGRYIEAKYKERTLFYVENIGRSLPAVAHRVEDDSEEDLPVENINENDIIRVYPGEPVPVDGVLLVGAAEVDESMITGEFVPVNKKAGDNLYSGSRCMGAPLQVRVTAGSENSTLARLSDLARESMKEMPETQQTAEKISRYFIATVLLMGLATFSFWAYYREGGMQSAVVNTVTLLIAACPCALNLSIPTAFIVGLQRAFSLGMLLKGGQVIDRLAKTDMVVFDKTGTLTVGAMKIQAQSHTVSTHQNRNNAVTVALEKAAGIKHPVAEALLSLDTSETVKAQQVENISGRGIRGRIENRDYIIGSPEFMAEFGLEVPAGLYRNHNGTVACLAETGSRSELLSVYLLADELRPEAEKVISSISARHRVIMLTGDNIRSATQVAESLNITEFYAGQKPVDKKNMIEKWQQQGHRPVMIGDGINDVVALAAAGVGVSFANAAQVSAYSGDVLLLSENLYSFEKLLKLAQITSKRIRQNLIMSFLYNFTLLPLAFSGAIIPLVGAIAMSVSSLVVVLNSLRIYRSDLNR